MKVGEFIYYEPRTGVTYYQRPERRNTYRLRNTSETVGAIKRLFKSSSLDDLVAWLEANKVSEDDPGMEDGDWRDLREAYEDLRIKLADREALLEGLETDVDVRDIFLEDVEALVELTGKLVI